MFSCPQWDVRKLKLVLLVCVSVGVLLKNVDKLVDVVVKMGDKAQTHVSATPLSPVLAAHSSPRVEDDGNKQLPTFEETVAIIKSGR